MLWLKHFVNDISPRYFRSLPVPQSAIYDWIRLIPPPAVFAGFCYMLYLAYWPGARKCKPPAAGKCNPKIRKYERKVIDNIDTENIYERATFCRCWRSKNWPYCDGSHAKHNFETADNVGPLIVNRRLEMSTNEPSINNEDTYTERTL